MLSLPPLSLYVHLPWCERKCPYCDFNSYQRESVIPEGAYVERLLQDLDTELPLAQGRALCSIFIGGGTPSLFSAAAIARLLAGIRARIALTPDCELTLESNPGSAETAWFRGYREAGINRLSIGVQSFNDACLRALGRVHDSATAHAAIAAAQHAGFENINLDLMHGLPGQSEMDALADLRQALKHGVSHLSWYQLTLEPNTVFHSAPPQLPTDDVLAEIQQQGQAVLLEAGYLQYEVSAYAVPARQCRHNLNYWRFGDYLGIGAGAHGKITLPAEGRVVRTSKTRVPRDYLAATISAGMHHPVGAADLPLEFLMNSLRLCEGTSVAEFERYTGLKYEAIAAVVTALRTQQLLVTDPDRLCTTSSGFRFLNTVLERFT